MTLRSWVASAGMAGAILTASAAACAADARPLPGKTLRVYHLGNSLTRCVPLERLAKLFEAAGGKYEYGMQLGGGHSLDKHLSKRNHGNRPGQGKYNTVKPYGEYDRALSQFTFDALVLQPYRRELDEKLNVRKRWPYVTAGTFQAASAFLDYALARGKPSLGQWDVVPANTENVATRRFYVYATWPSVADVLDREGEKTYAATYAAEYGGGVQCCRDFFVTLVKRLNGAYPDLEVPVRMIPAGEVLAVLDERIRAGKLPGIEAFFQRNQAYFVKSRRNNKKRPAFDPDTFDRSAGVLNLYADNVHMNDQPHNGRDSGTIGSYVAAATIYATLTGGSPAGMTVAPYEQFDAERDAELIRAVQQVVWEVVAGHEYSGVPAPAPH